MVNKFMNDMCNEIAENFSGKEFTVNDLMEHFNEMSVDSSSGSEDESKPKAKKAKKAKKEKKPKDPNAPKKPTNSYMYFSKHTREEDPATKYNAKQLGAMWKDLANDEPEAKATFEEMAKKDNDRYKKEKEEYESNQ